MMPRARQIGAENVRKALKSQPRGLSKRIAHRAGVSESTLSKVRRGMVEPNAEVARAVGFRRIILYIREEELALADRIEAELMQGQPPEPDK